MALTYKDFTSRFESAPADSVALLERKFCSLLISLDFAHSLDATSTYEVEKEEIRQRELLQVEKRRAEERQRVRNSLRYQREMMSAELHERLFEQLSETLNNPDYVRTRILAIEPNALSLVDVVQARAASMKALEQKAQGLDWLHEQLLRVVNLPPFADAKDKRRVKVTSVRNALGFVGIDDLRILIPAMAMQHWLPKRLEPFNLLRRKLWEHSLATAITCQVLAELDGQLDPVIAFLTGLFHDLGKAAVARLYVVCFDDVQRDLLRELRAEVRSHRYNALLEIEPSELMLRNLMMCFAKTATARLIEGLGLQHIPIAESYQNLAKASAPTALTGYSKILYQAAKYSDFRMLYAAKLVDAEAGREMSRDAHFNHQTLALLKTVKLTRLRLNRGMADQA
ncbi:HDOD domain-containing protein [Aliidiomarina celeris]|uniref:HDOD domain-containing protein n=1 Tax=Aliidiomarina celeris TaxID=2249428 RepID=UPI000DEB4DA8|nr:HDOD domain-containing protein [Aliidiomarina celeris]